MNKEKLVIGTRGSELALWQAHLVRDALGAVCDKEVEIKVISTRGDERLDIALHTHQLSKGLFTEELERELLNGKIDFAVHSLKDMPVDMPEGLVLSAVLKRADPRDVVISNRVVNTIDDLKGHRIGTSSPRRVAQLKQFLGCEAEFLPVRGNVQTRIQKLRDGGYDSIIMAAAGIERLGLQDEITMYIPLEVVLPAPGQASVAVQCAEANSEARFFAGLISHPEAMLCTHIERRLLKKIGGGCALPLGALCERKADERISISAFYANEDLSKAIRLDREYDIETLKEALEDMVDNLIAEVK